jgi:hypothetical protein
MSKRKPPTKDSQGDESESSPDTCATSAESAPASESADTQGEQALGDSDDFTHLLLGAGDSGDAFTAQVATLLDVHHDVESALRHLQWLQQSNVPACHVVDPDVVATLERMVDAIGVARTLMREKMRELMLERMRERNDAT